MRLVDGDDASEHDEVVPPTDGVRRRGGSKGSNDKLNYAYAMEQVKSSEVQDRIAAIARPAIANYCLNHKQRYL